VSRSIARILPTPRRFAPLRKFSCGRKGDSWEKAINDWAKRLYSGKVDPQTVVVLEDTHGKLIGLASFWERDLEIPGQPTLHGIPYIRWIATDRLYQRKRLGDDTSPGDALLVRALKHIKDVWGGGALPCVYAFVNPDNRPSHDLFKRHGFAEISPEGEGDAIRILWPADESVAQVA
jgi:ribosomal protein S18 acetylase RimI-like enzyme